MSDPANESVPQLEDSITEQKQIDGLSRRGGKEQRGKISRQIALREESGE